VGAGRGPLAAKPAREGWGGRHPKEEGAAACAVIVGRTVEMCCFGLGLGPLGAARGKQARLRAAVCFGSGGVPVGRCGRSGLTEREAAGRLLGGRARRGPRQPAEQRMGQDAAAASADTLAGLVNPPLAHLASPPASPQPTRPAAARARTQVPGRVWEARCGGGACR
jgi:hypothetical protein